MCALGTDTLIDSNRKIFDEIPGKSAEGHEGGREKMVVWRRKG